MHYIKRITTFASLSMPETVPISTINPLEDIGTLELARVLAERLAIGSDDWHRLKSNRNARAREQAAAALVFLLTEQREEALARFQQAVNWLDGSISAPPCPDRHH